MKVKTMLLLGESLNILMKWSRLETLCWVWNFSDTLRRHAERSLMEVWRF